MKANPPWATRLLQDNWEAISAEVAKPSWMPKRAGKKFAELGCGHYGCVYETTEPGIVFKISTDASEVEFVKTAMKIGEWPDGIVRYSAVLDVNGVYRGRSAFVVWREEAFDVGKIGDGPDPHAQREFTSYHGAYRNAAAYVRAASTKPGFDKKLAAAKELEDWAWNNVIWEDGKTTFRLTQVIPFHAYAPARRLAAALRICAICFELMEHTNYAHEVGAALAFYLERGILLADVHMNNVGKVTRTEGGYTTTLAVITDPGHAVDVSR